VPAQSSTDFLIQPLALGKEVENGDTSLQGVPFYHLPLANAGVFCYFLLRYSGRRTGRITHYFSKIGVGVVELTKGVLKVGDTIHIKGHTTDLFQKVESMQVEHAPVETAKKGESFGLHVESAVREHDTVFKVTED
jgi:hypothetical protein